MKSPRIKLHSLVIPRKMRMFALTYIPTLKGVITKGAISHGFTYDPG